MYTRFASRCAAQSFIHKSVAARAFSTGWRRAVTAVTTPSISVSCSLIGATCTGRRLEHTGAPSQISSDDLSTQLNDLMDAFAEARELIKDAHESIGTTYFGDDMEDAEAQTKEVLKRWADVQTFLEKAGKAEELQKLRNMHDLKIKQMEAELETVRDAGGSG